MYIPELIGEDCVQINNLTYPFAVCTVTKVLGLVIKKLASFASIMHALIVVISNHLFHLFISEIVTASPHSPT